MLRCGRGGSARLRRTTFFEPAIHTALEILDARETEAPDDVDGPHRCVVALGDEDQVALGFDPREHRFDRRQREMHRARNVLPRFLPCVEEVHGQEVLGDPIRRYCESRLHLYILRLGGSLRASSNGDVSFCPGYRRPSLPCASSNAPYDEEMTLTRPRRAPQTRHEQRDVTVNGLRLRYIDIRPAVEEDEPVLLIHGHSSRLEEYEELVPHLAARRRVLIPDMPGSGYSDKPARNYDLAFLEDSLLGFLDEMGVEQTHLAGGSLGGNLVLRLAQREPRRFSRLAAWAPAGAWEPLRGWAIMARIMKRLKFMFWPALYIQSRFWYRRDWPGRDAALRDAWAYYEEVYGDAFHRMYWDIGIDQVEQSLFGDASDIGHAVYLAYGDQDTGLSMDQGVQHLATLLPKVHLRVFEGARHSLANEVPAELGREVDAFLSETAAWGPR